MSGISFPTKACLWQPLQRSGKLYLLPRKEASMRKIKRVLLPFLLFMAAVGSAMADMKDDVTAAYKAWDEAFNKGDAKAVTAFYAPDAKVLPTTHVVVIGPA